MELPRPRDLLIAGVLCLLGGIGALAILDGMPKLIDMSLELYAGIAMVVFGVGCIFVAGIINLSKNS